MTDQPVDISISYDCSPAEQHQASLILSGQPCQAIGQKGLGSINWKGMFARLIFLGFILGIIRIISQGQGHGNSVISNTEPTLLTRLSLWAFGLGTACWILGIILISIVRRQQKRRAAIGITYSFDQYGLTKRRLGHQEIFSWARFLKYDEGPDVFVLRTEAVRGIVVPKRLFSDDDQRDRIRSLLAQKITSDFVSTSIPGSSNSNMRVEFSLSVEDCYEASIAKDPKQRQRHLASIQSDPSLRAEHRKTTLASVLIVSGLMPMLIAPICLSSPEQPLWILSVALLVALLWVSGPQFIPQWRRRKVRRLFAANPRSADPAVFEIDEIGFRFRSADWQEQVEWSAVQSCFSSDTLFLLVDDTPRTFMVPKRAFASSQMQDEFFEFIRMQISKARLSRENAPGAHGAKRDIL